jgi:ketopantoate reductase
MRGVHVAVIGAGALGRVYGVGLAIGGRSSVTFVVRKERAEDFRLLRILRTLEALLQRLEAR